MAASPRTLQRAALRLLTAADAAANRLYGWRYNPLYQSGTIVILLLLVLIVTGLWLILFYRVGSPYESVARIAADPWVGSWVRSVHRYASDAAVIFIVIHVVRMYAQGRSWGPRALAWLSGVVALVLLWICGVTGFVMVWDSFGQHLAREGARMLDSLPFLSEPLGRAFTGEQELSGAFFFVNLFAHIAIPLGVGLLLWIHVSRVARPALLPPRTLALATIGVLVAAALIVPAALAPEASAFQLPVTVPINTFYAFWLPLVQPMPGGVALGTMIAASVAFLSVPVLTRRRGVAAPPPSHVDESLCTGCRQCAEDCPYEAITMIARAPDGVGANRSAEVARVNPDLCVSCGICSGSCAPMGVGPPERTGRDQLSRVREYMTSAHVRDGRTVVVCCDRGATGWRSAVEAAGAGVYEVDCAGNLHSSVIELLVRGGASGVLVIACPPRDCWNREGPKWLGERLYHEREAELQERVDRHRVRVAYANASEAREALVALQAFVTDTAALDGSDGEADPEIDAICEPISLERDS